MKVIILRGVSGSGKTTLANEFEKLETRSVIVSADKYFIDKETGEYKYDRSKLNDAHAWCLRKYLETLQSLDWVNLLIVDNTNTRAVEVAPYYELAKMMKFPVGVITLIADPTMCWESTQHGVELPTILKHSSRIMDPNELPPWWRHTMALRTCEPAGVDPDGTFIYEDNLALDPIDYLERLT